MRLVPECIGVKLEWRARVRSLRMSAAASWKLAQRSATSCSLSGARAIASCRSAVLSPASEKCGSGRPSIGRGSAMVARPRLAASLDRRAAGIAEAEQLRGLVEGLAKRIVERRAEPLVVADVLDDEKLRVAARDEQQEIGEARGRR